jgi:hypothetical protein
VDAAPFHLKKKKKLNWKLPFRVGCRVGGRDLADTRGGGEDGGRRASVLGEG